MNTGSSWRDLPEEEFGPNSTVHGRYRKWLKEGLWRGALVSHSGSARTMKLLTVTGTVGLVALPFPAPLLSGSLVANNHWCVRSESGIRVVSGWCALSGASVLLLVLGEPEQRCRSIRMIGKGGVRAAPGRKVRAWPYIASKQMSLLTLQ
jgi:hypothetical protein